MKCPNAKRINFALGIRRNLYSTDWNWGFVLGVTKVLGLASGLTQIVTFLETNMLV